MAFYGERWELQFVLTLKGNHKGEIKIFTCYRLFTLFLLLLHLLSSFLSCMFVLKMIPPMNSKNRFIANKKSELLKGQFTSKSKIHILPFTCSSVNPSRLFWCELLSFGDIHPLLNITGLDCRSPAVLKVVSFPKAWPINLRKSCENCFLFTNECIPAQNKRAFTFNIIDGLLLADLLMLASLGHVYTRAILLQTKSFLSIYKNSAFTWTSKSAVVCMPGG